MANIKGLNNDAGTCPKSCKTVPGAHNKQPNITKASAKMTVDHRGKDAGFVVK